jgi:hypothetical protein
MNNNYSPPEYYFKRWITPLLIRALEDMPVLVVTGARQVGKSTLLRNEEPFCEWRYVSMDDYAALELADKNPNGLWAGTDRIILDEVQKAPRLLSAVKQVVDQAPGKIKFVLSGSANLKLMERVSESLAGRALYFELNPLAIGEINGTTPPSILTEVLQDRWPHEGLIPKAPADPLLLLQRGLMPALIQMKSPASWLRWWDAYVATYLERDLRQVAQIDALVDYRRMMELLALRSGQLLNQSDLARDAGLSQPTAHRYLNILETTCLFERLPSFTESHTTRIVKAPKAFWNDTGLAIFLAGYFQEEELRSTRELGHFFETMIYHHLRILTQMMSPPAKLFTWRTRKQQEVDFILEYGQKILAIEVKQTATPGFGDVAGLREFLDLHPRAVGGILLHSGAEVRWLGEKIMALPWTMITG